MVFNKLHSALLSRQIDVELDKRVEIMLPDSKDLNAARK